MLDLWQENCRRVVRAVLADRGWKLVDWDALARTICGELAGSQAANDVIERVTVRHYCRILYSACKDPGSGRQHRGLQELRRYLRSIALYKTHDAGLAEELTQEAHVKVWKNLARCHDPDRFLGFAQLVLINTIRDHYRKAFRRDGKSSESNFFKVEVTQSEILASNSVERGEAPLQSAGDSIEPDLTHLFADETKQAWLVVIERCVANCEYRAVLIQSFFENKSFKQISDDLGIPVGTVYVYRKRALLALRNCSAFKRFFNEKISG